MAGVITEIAAECGVSEQAVRAWCRRNHVSKDAKGSFAISESQKNRYISALLGDGRNQVSLTGESKLRNLGRCVDFHVAKGIRP